MNSFLNRIIAPGLRRIEPRLASFRKAVLPRKGMSQIEESPPFEKDDPKGRPEKGPVITPETPPQPPDPNRALASLEKTSTSPSDGKRSSEKSEQVGETLSFEPVDFDPASPYPTMRQFQSMEKQKGAAASSMLNERPSAREIVWEVVPTASPAEGFPAPGRFSEAKKVGSDPSDPMLSSFSGERPPRSGPVKEEGVRDPVSNPPAAPIPAGKSIPPSDSESNKEKGDLIIEQLDVRVVAEPERRPERTKVRSAAPKRSGAWETAARYYLGKV